MRGARARGWLDSCQRSVLVVVSALTCGLGLQRMPSVGQETAAGFQPTFIASGGCDPGVEWCAALVGDLRYVVAAASAANADHIVSEQLIASELGPVIYRLAGAIRLSGGPSGAAAAPAVVGLLHGVLRSTKAATRYSGIIGPQLLEPLLEAFSREAVIGELSDDPVLLMTDGYDGRGERRLRRLAERSRPHGGARRLLRRRARPRTWGRGACAPTIESIQIRGAARSGSGRAWSTGRSARGGGSSRGPSLVRSDPPLTGLRWPRVRR